MYLRALAALLCASLSAACASVPQYRPIYDLPTGRSVEVGVVPQAGIGIDGVERELTGVAPGANAWATFRTPAGFDVFGAGHGSVGLRLRDGMYAGNQFGAALGIRYRVQQDFLPDMRFAFELMGDYLQDDYTFLNRRQVTRRHVSGIARIPIAQRAYSGVWVYTAPTLGISVPLYDDPPAPFFGINEMPIGVVARVTDWVSVVVEGGYLIPLNGAYASVGAIFML